MAKPKNHDPKYLDWLAAQGCMICRMPATVHHCRTCGSARDDHHTLPLCPRHHQIQFGKDSIEFMGRRKFEHRFGIDIEAKIAEYRERYLATRGAANRDRIVRAD